MPSDLIRGWTPVRVKKMRQTKRSRGYLSPRASDNVLAETTCGSARELAFVSVDGPQLACLALFGVGGPDYAVVGDNDVTLELP